MKSSSQTGTLLLSGFFLLYLVFWLVLNLFFPLDSEFFNYFSDTYGVAAAIGGLFGYLASRNWGGLKSIMGRSLAFFSAGLFFQFLGQVTYAIYFYMFHIDNAYPSVGDIFYFGSIPLYIIAIFFLFQILKLRVSLHSNFKRLVAVIIPLFFVTASYFAFLRNYEFDLGAVLTAFFDFGYPFGEAIFLGLTIVAILFTSSALGGKLRKHIILLFVALITQYIADTIYLMHTTHDTWRAGGFDDLFYLSAYFVMGLTLMSFGKAFEELRSGRVASNESVGNVESTVN